MVSVGAVMQAIGMILLALLSYIGVEVRRDVREMSKKVTILWDRSERDQKQRSKWDGIERRHPEETGEHESPR